MRHLLQSLLHSRKTYDRPHDEWTCGRAAEGCPCIYGPSRRGECRATGQCLPAKNGDRWVCTRTLALGGLCEAGPGPDGGCGCPVAPCQPVRSLRARRGETVWLAVGLALGLVILVVLGPDRARWTSPGPLTNQHAVSAQDCAACHAETPGLLLSAADRGERDRLHDQLCINCHDLGAQGRSPHGVSEAGLLALARGQAPATGRAPLLLTAAQQAGVPEQLACATCHREHRGAEFNLRHMADQQCQICHQVQFAGFAQGHPEFAGYPYARRTRLQFDHVSHFQRHFTDARLPSPGPTSCAHCHEPAPDGGKMLVRGFAQGCAQCHAGQIQGEGRAGDKGLVFFRLPDIDVATLAAAGHEVGEWPRDCEGGLTPFMRWMLEGDASTRAALAEIDNVPLSDLRATTPAQRAAAVQLLWSIKGLFADLVTEGQLVILARLGSVTTGRSAAAERAGQFSADAALAAQQAWLPNLLVEVAARRRGKRVPAAGRPVAAAAFNATATPSATAVDDDLLSDAPPVTPPAPVPGLPRVTPAPALPAALPLRDAEERAALGGWYRRDDSHTLHYRPVGHEDAFLQAWLEETAGHPAPSAQRIFAQLSAENAPGVCLKCHSVDQSATTVVNWRASRPQPGWQPFTRFRHAAHFSLMGDQGCMTCHTFAVGADYAGSFGANRNPALFRSNFAPLSKDSCATCHQPSRSGESCLQCHNYHTGERQRLRSQAAEMPAKPKGARPSPRP